MSTHDSSVSSNKERVSWSREAEKMLMECYSRARNNQAFRSDKGIKTKAWNVIVNELNEKGFRVDKGAMNASSNG